jgi:hypothetical protein
VTELKPFAARGLGGARRKDHVRGTIVYGILQQLEQIKVVPGKLLLKDAKEPSDGRL